MTDPIWIGLGFLAGMLVLIALGIPIAFAMLATGTVGLVVVEGFRAAESQLLLNFWGQSTAFVLTAVPLYILMGQLVHSTRIASDLYEAVYKWVGWMPGGLAITSVLACAGFGAVSGGSATAVATLGPMCMPEMQRYRYSQRLAAGSIASAGTLGILIPPSIILVVYGVWTETSIGHLFIAGIIPGIVLTLLFTIVILGQCALRPELGPPGPHFPWGERIRSLSKVLPIFAVFVLVIGGIYAGAFDPSEAAAIGVAGILIIALVMRRIDLRSLKQALLGTMHTSAMLFLIITGGHVVGRFVVQTHLTSSAVAALEVMHLPALATIAMFTLMYLVLGMILDVWAMLILTIPFVFPLIVNLHMDPVWFGVYVTVMSEVALITPPVGVNVYVMAKVAPDVPLVEIFRGIVPFFFAVMVLIALITVFPRMVTWLPEFAFG